MVNIQAQAARDHFSPGSVIVIHFKNKEFSLFSLFEQLALIEWRPTRFVSTHVTRLSIRSRQKTCRKEMTFVLLTNVRSYEPLGHPVQDMVPMELSKASINERTFASFPL